MSTQRWFFLSGVLFIGGWVLLLPRGGYAQTAATTHYAMPLHLAATVLFNVGASRTSPLLRVVLALGSLALLAFAGIITLSNLYFWNGEP